MSEEEETRIPPNNLTEEMKAFIDQDRCIGVEIRDDSKKTEEEIKNDDTYKYTSAYLENLAEYENGIILMSDITKPDGAIGCFTACELSGLIIAALTDPLYGYYTFNKETLRGLKVLFAYTVDALKLYNMAFRNGYYNSFGIIPLEERSAEKRYVYSYIFPVSQKYYLENQRLSQFTEDDQQVLFTIKENFNHFILSHSQEDNSLEISIPRDEFQNSFKPSYKWIQRNERYFKEQQVYVYQGNLRTRFALPKITIDAFLNNNFNNFVLQFQENIMVGEDNLNSLENILIYYIIPFPKNHSTNIFTSISLESLKDCPPLTDDEIRDKLEENKAKVNREEANNIMAQENAVPIEIFQEAVDTIIRLRAEIIIYHRETGISIRDILSNFIVDFEKSRTKLLVLVYTGMTDSDEYREVDIQTKNLLRKIYTTRFILRLPINEDHDSLVNAIIGANNYLETEIDLIKLIISMANDPNFIQDDNLVPIAFIQKMIEVYHVDKDYEKIQRIKNRYRDALREIMMNYQEYVVNSKSQGQEPNEDVFKEMKAKCMKIYNFIEVLNWVEVLGTLDVKPIFEESDYTESHDEDFERDFGYVVTNYVYKKLKDSVSEVSAKFDRLIAALLTNNENYEELKKQYTDMLMKISQNEKFVKKKIRTIEIREKAKKCYEKHAPFLFEQNREFLQAMHDLYFESGDFAEKYQSISKKYKELDERRRQEENVVNDIADSIIINSNILRYNEK